jgi:pimeloyl-ACP methyl ester carboxylesterase
MKFHTGPMISLGLFSGVHMMNNQDQIIVTKNGHEIQILQAGKPDGMPILVHHGTPGSRLLRPKWIEDAESQGIRLIGYDRPGYGGSTPSPDRTVANAAEDVAAIANALNLDRLAVWGISGGGPHALACAALQPDLVIAAASLASPAPYQADGLDWLAGMGESNVEEFGAALEGRDVLEQFVEAETPGMLSADPGTLLDALRSLLSPVDAEVLTGDIVADLINTIIEGIKERRNGWVDDDIAFIKPWDFDLEQIQIPVLLLHGTQDRFVPYSHGEWLAKQIPGVDARILPDDGHITLAVNRVSEVHSWLLNKMQ